MRRNGFTMVELIFVIVIIGILAATALPKFGGTRDKARINSELAAMSSLDGAITAAREFRYDDYGDTYVNWHDLDAADLNITVYTAAGTSFAKANSAKSVLKGIAKKTDGYQIEAYTPINGSGTFNSMSDYLYYFPVVITGPASNPTTGVNYDEDHDGQDIPGKPDKNDFWVFNPSNSDINIVNTNDPDINPVTIPSGSIGLVDVNGTAQVTRTNIRYEDIITPTTIRQFYINNL